MNTAQLLAVVEVPHDERIRCQSPGCNHSVYRRIHVVREESGISVYGSECFKKLFRGLPIASTPPKYTTGDGKKLTDEERRLLIENTERLVQQFEAEAQAEAERQAAIAARPPTTRWPSPVQSRPRSFFCNKLDLERREVEHEAEERVRAERGIDPLLPGWRGIVEEAIDQILAERKKERNR